MKARAEIDAAIQGKGCLGKAHPDEPVFILRDQDLLASELVRQWAHSDRRLGCSPEKVQEALDCAKAMSQWPNRKYPD